MKNKRILTLAAMALVAFAAGPATAAEPYEVSPGPEPGMGYKFGRGAVNVLTCWTEIPRNVALEWQRTDPASGFFLGVGKGLGYGYARFMSGMYDMITFPFPVPIGNAPVMDPEFSAYNEYSEAPSSELTVQPLDVEMHKESADPEFYSARSRKQWP